MPLLRLSRSWSFVALLAMGTMVLDGCATQGLSSIPLNTVYYKDCYDPINYLREAEKKRQMAVAVGAAGGLILGGLTGGVLGGSAELAGVGAIAGAVIGSAGAYALQKHIQFQDDKLRFASYADDIRKDTSEMNTVLAAVEEAQICYKKELSTLKASKRAKTMSGRERRERMNEILTGLSEINALIEGAGKNFDDSIEISKTAYETELSEKGVDKKKVYRAAKKPRPKAVPIKTNKTKNSASKKVAAKSKRSSAPKRELDEYYVSAGRELRVMSQTNDRRRQIQLNMDQLLADACSQGGEYGGGVCAKIGG